MKSRKIKDASALATVSQNGIHIAAPPSETVSAHHCHAKRCLRACPPESLMCPHHWRLVPKTLQNAVWRAYRPGQCDDKRPSQAWFDAANVAIKHVDEWESAGTVATLYGLTLWRPWAWAITHSTKRIENREWAPPPKMKNRMIAIHAGKTFDKDAAVKLAGYSCDLVPCAEPCSTHEEKHSTGIVAVARIVDILALSPHVSVSEGQEIWANDAGFGWLLADLVVFQAPVPCKGSQGLWAVMDSTLADCKTQYRVSKPLNLAYPRSWHDNLDRTAAPTMDR